MELRREERAGREDAPYASALRRVLRAFTLHEGEDALIVLEDEILDLERKQDPDTDEIEALRKVLELIEAKPSGNRELFRYYLRKMELDGRGDEPFARALRRALDSSEGPSIDKLFVWKEHNKTPD